MVPENPKKENLIGLAEPSNTAVYDKTRRQQIIFETEDDDNRYRYVFEVEDLANDDEFYEFDNLQQMRLVENGNDRDLEVDNLEACVWFFDRNLKLVSGYDGDDAGKAPPENWQDEFEPDEKQEIVNTLLAGDVYMEDKVKTIKKREFGSAKLSSTITIKAHFNAAEVLVPFTFPPKETKHIKAYKKITNSAKFKKGRDGTFIPPTWRKLVSLYNEIGVSTEANPAVPVIALAMRERYDTTLKRQTKKLSR